MRNLKEELKTRIISYDKLLEYGFQKTKDSYIYQKNIIDNSFKIIVELGREKQISKLIDLETGEDYILVDVKNTKGRFVGEIKENYEEELEKILKHCTTLNIFQSKQAREVIQYIKQKYQDDLEYLWEKFSNNAIWRNKENQKWYGLLVRIEESKIGIDSKRVVDAIVLRYQKDKIQDIIDNKKIFPGYHMNKSSWITIKLDDTIEIEEIYNFIDNSYRLSIGRGNRSGKL